MFACSGRGINRPKDGNVTESSLQNTILTVLTLVVRETRKRFPFERTPRRYTMTGGRVESHICKVPVLGRGENDDRISIIHYTHAFCL